MTLINGVLGFNIPLPISDLLADANKSLTAQTVSTDIAGNSVVVTRELTYELDQAPSSPQLSADSLWSFFGADPVYADQNINGLNIILKSTDPDSTSGGLVFSLLPSSGLNDNSFVDIVEGNRLVFKSSIDPSLLNTKKFLRFDVGVRESLASDSKPRASAALVINKTMASKNTPHLSDTFDSINDGVLRFPTGKAIRQNY